MINIDLVARGKLVGMYIGILECFVYAFICFRTQLYGEVVKSLLISVPLNFYSVFLFLLEIIFFINFMQSFLIVSTIIPAIKIIIKNSKKYANEFDFE